MLQLKKNPTNNLKLVHQDLMTWLWKCSLAEPCFHIGQSSLGNDFRLSILGLVITALLSLLRKHVFASENTFLFSCLLAHHILFSASTKICCQMRRRCGWEWPLACCWQSCSQCWYTSLRPQQASRLVLTLAGSEMWWFLLL